MTDQPTTAAEHRHYRLVCEDCGAQVPFDPPAAAAPRTEARPRASNIGELTRAIELANRVLDQPSADPDGDLAVLARQLLRLVAAPAAAALPICVSCGQPIKPSPGSDPAAHIGCLIADDNEPETPR